MKCSNIILVLRPLIINLMSPKKHEQETLLERKVIQPTASASFHNLYNTSQHIMDTLHYTTPQHHAPQHHTTATTLYCIILCGCRPQHSQVPLPNTPSRLVFTDSCLHSSHFIRLSLLLLHMLSFLHGRRESTTKRHGYTPR